MGEWNRWRCMFRARDKHDCTLIAMRSTRWRIVFEKSNKSIKYSELLTTAEISVKMFSFRHDASFWLRRVCLCVLAWQTTWSVEAQVMFLKMDWQHNSSFLSVMDLHTSKRCYCKTYLCTLLTPFIISHPLTQWHRCWCSVCMHAHIQNHTWGLCNVSHKMFGAVSNDTSAWVLYGGL